MLSADTSNYSFLSQLKYKKALVADNIGFTGALYYCII